MKFIKYIILILTVVFPINAISGGLIDRPDTDLANSGILRLNIQLSAYYDLRNRESYIQITNISSTSQTIHVQIFQHDRNCSELDFFDELTPNDTVIYDMNNIVKNNGSTVPINLQDDSYGYVVITTYEGDPDDHDQHSLIGNWNSVS